MKHPFLKISTITTEGTEHLQIYETATDFNDENPIEQAIRWLIIAIEATGKGTNQGVKAELKIETAFRTMNIKYNSHDTDNKTI